MSASNEFSLDHGEKIKNQLKTNKRNLLYGAYIAGFSGVAAITFGYLSARSARKKTEEYYKDLNFKAPVVLENPTLLAFKALGYATVITVGVFSLTIFGICKFCGIHNLEDLRRKVQANRKPQEGRTEFENLSDFLQYINDTYQTKPQPDKKNV